MITAAVLLLIIPVTVAIAGVSLPAAFSETYYGELPYMYEELENTEGKRIILIGNSAVAFGVRSDLLESELEDYSAVNFGLYGAVGTKAMLDLADGKFREGDIVIIMPEPYAQTSSLYFSASDAYRATEKSGEMRTALLRRNFGKLLAGYLPYVSELFQRRNLLSSEGDEEYPAVKNNTVKQQTSVYERSAFEDKAGKNVCYMTFDRPYNVMPGGYDAVNTPTIAAEVYGEGFIDYLNEYAKRAQKAGAKVFYGFTPINSLALDKDAGAAGDAVYDYLKSSLEFDILSHPAKYFLDYRWFYDNNVHLNSSGAVVFTALLAEDIKMCLGRDAKVSFALPEIPEVPVMAGYASDAQISGDKGDDDHAYDNDALGDRDSDKAVADAYSDSQAYDMNRDAAAFTWELREDVTGQYIRITGLTDIGRKATELAIPTDYDGVSVREFAADVFAGNTTIARLVLPPNVTTIYDNSFEGAKRLTELILLHRSVLNLNVGENVLAGADNCCVYVRSDVQIADCAGGWERYKKRIRYY
ncbi:MAG: hypothetical protein J6Y89_02405 [Lachnospiraceae bacterium]|nr:hypothetical protein [Lachnospiraceae bacterium]